MPWQLSYAASTELENSELQTDVMRFMAILAFCLVAIFAIVQSIPLQPAAAASEAAGPMQAVQPPAQPRAQPAAAPVAAAPVAAIESRRPDPAPAVVRTRPRPEPPRQSEPRPAPQPEPPGRTVAAPAPPPAPVAPPAATGPPASQPGLSLRFESDATLRSLVERRIVGLFAIDGSDFYRMSVSGGQIDFAPGPAPAQYHQMIRDTVPIEVIRSFRARRGPSAREATWGVTLPAATTRQLRRFVDTRFQGGLVITAEAALALADGR